MAIHEVVLNSTSGSDDEEEVVVEEKVQQSIDVESGTTSAILLVDEIMSKITEMSCQFAEIMEQQRTLHFMAKKKSALATLAASYSNLKQRPCNSCHLRFQWYTTPVVNMLP